MWRHHITLFAAVPSRFQSPLRSTYKKLLIGRFIFYVRFRKVFEVSLFPFGGVVNRFYHEACASPFEFNAKRYFASSFILLRPCIKEIQSYETPRGALYGNTFTIIFHRHKGILCTKFSFLNHAKVLQMANIGFPSFHIACDSKTINILVGFLDRYYS